VRFLVDITSGLNESYPIQGVQLFRAGAEIKSDEIVDAAAVESAIGHILTEKMRSIMGNRLGGLPKKKRLNPLAEMMLMALHGEHERQRDDGIREAQSKWLRILEPANLLSGDETRMAIWYRIGFPLQAHEEPSGLGDFSGDFVEIGPSVKEGHYYIERELVDSLRYDEAFRAGSMKECETVVRYLVRQLTGVFDGYVPANESKEAEMSWMMRRRA